MVGDDVARARVIHCRHPRLYLLFICPLEVLIWGGGVLRHPCLGAPPDPHSGLIFKLRWKKLSGSYRRFRATNRSQLGPYAARARPPSSLLR